VSGDAVAPAGRGKRASVEAMTRAQVLLVLPVVFAIGVPLFMLALERIADWLDGWGVRRSGRGCASRVSLQARSRAG
jgi:hypothetical protein